MTAIFMPNSKKIGERARKLLALKPVVIDTETTGLDRQAEIVEIAILDLDGQVLFESRVKPVKGIPAEATRIHGITDEMVKDCPDFGEITPYLFAIHGHPVTGYNVEFDIRMINQSARAVGITDSFNPDRADIMELFAKYYGDYSEYHGNYRFQSLAKACLELGILPNSSHAARADAEQARQVLVKLAEIQ